MNLWKTTHFYDDLFKKNKFCAIIIHTVNENCVLNFQHIKLRNFSIIFENAQQVISSVQWTNEYKIWINFEKKNSSDLKV